MSGRPSIPETSVLEPRGYGVLESPAFAGDDDGGTPRHGHCFAGARNDGNGCIAIPFPKSRTCVRVLAAYASEFSSHVPSLKQRAQGRPGAGWHPWSACNKKSTRQNHRFSLIRPAFPAQWFYGLYVISPVTRLSCHRCL